MPSVSPGSVGIALSTGYPRRAGLISWRRHLVSQGSPADHPLPAWGPESNRAFSGRSASGYVAPFHITTAAVKDSAVGEPAASRRRAGAGVLGRRLCRRLRRRGVLGEQEGDVVRPVGGPAGVTQQRVGQFLQAAPAHAGQ